MHGVDDAAVGLVALREGRWEQARAAFEAALAVRESPEVLDGLGEALWWLGEPQAAIEFRERAFAGFRRADDRIRAATTSLAVCVSYWVNFGNDAAGSGWLARAQRVLPDFDTSPLRGSFALMQGYATADFEQACELINRALAVARETGDADLEVSALSDLGGRLVGAGQVGQGLTLLDEAMAGAMSGECDRLETVVWVSCTMLGACEVAGDLARASQWLLVIDEFTERYGCPFMYATCRTHYGSLLIAKGRWDDAERELAAAVRMSGRAGPVPHALAVARMADLRLRQGRVEEAASLLTGCRDDLLTAKLQLARGEPQVAIPLLQRLSESPLSPADTAAVLALLVQAQLAATGPQDTAPVLDRLAALAATHPTDYIAAHHVFAAGRVDLARGDLDLATARLRTAADILARLDLPLDIAELNLALARAHAACSPHLAITEAQAALVAFDELGASTLADSAAALLRSLGAPGRRRPRADATLTKREQQILHLLGLGLSNPEIAQRLFISPKTTAHHVSSVLHKLGLRSRAEAAAHYTRTLGDRRP